MLQHDIAIQYTRGTRYVGGYIGFNDMEAGWIEPQISKWVDEVKALSKVTLRFPHTVFMGLVWSLQAERQYLSRVSPRAATKLVPVEEALRREFIPALFGRTMEVTDKDRVLYANSVKAGGLGIRDPCHEAGCL